MKKLINRAFVYLVAALAAGVFYREFTKFNGFTGKTAPAFLHPHLLMLGAFLLLLAALFGSRMPFIEEKRFRVFLTLHTIGLPFMAVMMLVRGVMQTLQTPLSKGMDAAISGFAGLSHIVLAAALVYFFLALKKALPAQETAS